MVTRWWYSSDCPCTQVFSMCEKHTPNQDMAPHNWHTSYRSEISPNVYILLLLDTWLSNLPDSPSEVPPSTTSSIQCTQSADITVYCLCLCGPCAQQGLSDKLANKFWFLLFHSVINGCDKRQLWPLHFLFFFTFFFFYSNKHNECLGWAGPSNQGWYLQED